MADKSSKSGEVVYGNGVRVTMENGDVVVRFRADGNYGPSGTGKSMIVATTSGNAALPGGIRLTLTAFVKTGTKPTPEPTPTPTASGTAS